MFTCKDLLNGNILASLPDTFDNLTEIRVYPSEIEKMEDFMIDADPLTPQVLMDFCKGVDDARTQVGLDPLVYIFVERWVFVPKTNSLFILALK